MEEKIINHSGENQEVSLKEILKKVNQLYLYILSKWILIFVIGIVGAIIGFIYASQKVTFYTATTTFVLESGDGGGKSLGQYAGLASMVGIDLGGGGGIFQGDNLLELYKSRNMIEKTLLSPTEQRPDKLLIDQYIEMNNLRQKWSKNNDLANLNFATSNDKQNSKVIRLKDSLISSIVADINLNYLKVSKPDKKLSIIKVDVKATDEYFAKSFNDQIVNTVNEFYIRTKTKKSLTNVNILQHKTDSVRAVMNGAIYAASSVADATPNLNPTRQVQRTAPMQRSQFSAEANKSVLSLLVQNLEMSKMSLLQETPLIQVVDAPVLPLEKYKLGRLKALVLGGIIAGFLTVLVLLFKKIMSTLLD